MAASGHDRPKRAVTITEIRIRPLDGELVALDARVHSDFNGLQQMLSGEAQLPLVFMLFDLPYLEGSDLSRVGLLERKQLLEKLLAHAPKHLAFTTHAIGDGQGAFQMATDEELEGIISKRVDSSYRPGRGDDWLKIKRLESDEFAVVGYTPLAQLGLESFLRTTTGKDLHVGVPLSPGCAWPQVKDFAHAFADTVAQAHPLEFIATATKAKRSGKIYVDYLRNSRGATNVASYSLRARNGAPAAVPLRWSELGKLKSGHDFDIRSTPKRLARLRADPWASIGDVQQGLDDIIGKLR